MISDILCKKLLVFGGREKIIKRRRKMKRSWFLVTVVALWAALAVQAGEFKGKIARSYEESEEWWPTRPRLKARRI